MKRILTSQKIYCTDSFIVREGIVLRNVLEGGDVMWTNLQVYLLKNIFVKCWKKDLVYDSRSIFSISKRGNGKR